MSEKNTPPPRRPKTSRAIRRSRSARRRGFLTGIAALGASATALGALGGCSSDDNDDDKPAPPPAPPTPPDTTRLLRDKVKTLVVIYAENRSFNNLFANFPGVEKPLSALTAADYTQYDRDGTALPALPPVWGGMVPQSQQANHITYQVDQAAPYMNNLANAPFALRGPQGTAAARRGHARSVARVLSEPDADQRRQERPLRRLGGFGRPGHGLLQRLGLQPAAVETGPGIHALRQLLQGAFGGSFLNHQYLVAAQPPVYPDAANSVAKVQIAQLQSADPTDTRLQPKPTSPASALTGSPQFGPSALSPDGFGVNTMGPPYWPAFSRSAADPTLADPANPMTMVPQGHANIGDLMTAKGLDWAWYAGGWQAAVDSTANTGFPSSPNFQAHHQPFNYFKSTAPGTPARTAHLRDGGLGDITATNKFLADIEAGKLPPLTFYKPQGNLNMHAGYADVESGDRHIAHIVDSLRNSPQWKNMVVVITVDENGGWWDHVAPPKGDRWGGLARSDAGDLAVLEEGRGGSHHLRHRLDPAPGHAVVRPAGAGWIEGARRGDEGRGQQPMGDLTNALTFGA